MMLACTQCGERFEMDVLVVASRRGLEAGWRAGPMCGPPNAPSDAPSAAAGRSSEWCFAARSRRPLAAGAVSDQIVLAGTPLTAPT